MRTGLRDGLLAGRRVAVTGPPDAGLGHTLAGLGADVVPAAGPGAVDALIVDHSTAQPGEPDSVPAELWDPVLAVAAQTMVPAGNGGRVLLIAPRAGGAAAAAARAACENLARTLSVEWARYGITVVALAPGPDTADGEIAALVAYLLSPAGEYFSGCRFELGVTGAPART